MPLNFVIMHTNTQGGESGGSTPRPSLAQKKGKVTSRESVVVPFPRVKIMNEIEAATGNARKLAPGKTTGRRGHCRCGCYAPGLSRRISPWLLLDLARQEKGAHVQSQYQTFLPFGS